MFVLLYCNNEFITFQMKMTDDQEKLLEDARGNVKVTRFKAVVICPFFFFLLCITKNIKCLIKNRG